MGDVVPGEGQEHTERAERSERADRAAERMDREDRADRADRAGRAERKERTGFRAYQALLWANVALIATALFSAGIFYQRVLDLEVRVRALQSAESLSVQISNLQNEVNRVRDRLDRYMDSGSGKPK